MNHFCNHLWKCEMNVDLIVRKKIFSEKMVMIHKKAKRQCKMHYLGFLSIHILPNLNNFCKKNTFDEIIINKY